MSNETLSNILRDRRILVVEDEWFIVTELVEFLTDNGAVVVGPAGDVGDGLALAETTERLDGAILNVALRGAYSYPIADLLRERGVPFAFATGIDNHAIPRAYADVPYITKPYEAATLVKALFERLGSEMPAV